MSDVNDMYYRMATEYYLAEESVQTEIRKLAENFKTEDLKKGIIMAYQLSDYGRALDWKSWQFLGGSGLPGSTNAYKTLGPQIFWQNMTLGKIEDACPATGRSLAYYAINNLKMPEFVKLYESKLKKGKYHGAE